jgi:hypothetical protein
MQLHKATAVTTFSQKSDTKLNVGNTAMKKKKRWSTPVVDKSADVPVINSAYAGCGTCYD